MTQVQSLTRASARSRCIAHTRASKTTPTRRSDEAHTHTHRHRRSLANSPLASPPQRVCRSMALVIPAGADLNAPAAVADRPRRRRPFPLGAQSPVTKRLRSWGWRQPGTAAEAAATAPGSGSARGAAVACTHFRLAGWRGKTQMEHKRFRFRQLLLQGELFVTT